MGSRSNHKINLYTKAAGYILNPIIIHVHNLIFYSCNCKGKSTRTHLKFVVICNSLYSMHTLCPVVKCNKWKFCNFVLTEHERCEHIPIHCVPCFKSRCSSRCWYRSSRNGRNTKQKELRGWMSYLKCFLGPNHWHEFKRIVLRCYFFCTW